MAGNIIRAGLAILAGIGVFTLIVVASMLCFYIIALFAKKIREVLRRR